MAYIHGTFAGIAGVKNPVQAPCPFIWSLDKCHYIQRPFCKQKELKARSSRVSNNPGASKQYGNSRSPRETLHLIQEGLLGDYPDEESLMLISVLDLKSLITAAGTVRDRAPLAHIISFSPKVFLPLTRACRDFCGYCTFSLPPKPGKAIYMAVDEVLDIARKGAELGCYEALFTIGDKPELRYPKARDELSVLGHATTISYVAEVAKIVLEETGLLPHINAGVMSQSDIARLRRVSVSQGLMLESDSDRLHEPGGPHYACPDKIPSSRLATIEAAGEENVPFTSGLLVGIGENREERILSLLKLRNLHMKYRHIQELIIQNFRAKKGTRMENAPEPSLEELQWTIAMARLTFGPYMNIQAPPNLTPRKASGDESEWVALIEAGINDWGGISPVTKDWINPEASWPQLCHISSASAKAGKILVPRLPIYPNFIHNGYKWLDSSVNRRVMENSNSFGYARAECWSPGMAVQAEDSVELLRLWKNIDSTTTKSQKAQLQIGNPKDYRDKVMVGIDGALNFQQEINLDDSFYLGIDDILQAASAGLDLKKNDIVQLFSCMGGAFNRVCSAADRLRSTVNGDKVTYVVNRNINYTNVCTFKCQFCAFSKGKANEALRGKPYNLSLEEISRRVAEAWERGATEVCMQGGIHPDFTGKTYLEILHCAKEAAPDIHIHAFSPLEVYQGARTLGISLKDFLKQLKRAGLGSLPGTAAEILHDEVRNILCPDKLTAQEWLQVMETAHDVGLRSTATIMFGHVDEPKHWAQHLLCLRELQKRTGGFTEFVPLPFVHMEAPMFLKGCSRKGPTRRECILMHAVSRLVLHPYIKNIQASWVKMGPAGAQALLMAGCNDMGGSLMNESITRAAGASHGQELLPQHIEDLIKGAGRIPKQRTTLYGNPSPVQVEKSFMAIPLNHPNVEVS